MQQQYTWKICLNIVYRVYFFHSNFKHKTQQNGIVCKRSCKINICSITLIISTDRYAQQKHWHKYTANTHSQQENCFYIKRYWMNSEKHLAHRNIVKTKTKRERERKKKQRSTYYNVSSYSNKKRATTTTTTTATSTVTVTASNSNNKTLPEIYPKTKKSNVCAALCSATMRYFTLWKWLNKKQNRVERRKTI